jgi:hypothetical protein
MRRAPIWLLRATLCLGLACGDAGSDTPAPRTDAGTISELPEDASAGPNIDPEASLGDAPSPRPDDAGAADRLDSGPEYTSSCEEQQCTANERCLVGPAGTYCVLACPGQPCPPGAEQVPYCTRTGGVICATD